MILNLISGPRNISTAIMYSFAQRNDTVVLDEPFYAIYLIKSGAHHPGRQEVIASQPSDENNIRKNILTRAENSVVFVKNMAHHMEELNNPLLPGAVNIFLIRDPKQIIASYTQVIEKPIMKDIGIEYQYALFKSLQDRGEHPIVMDSSYVVENPEVVLRRLCEQCSIPFQLSMLHWPSGPKEYDGVWAKHWYGNVHQSTGFDKQMTSSRPLPQHLNHLYNIAQRYYEKLLPFSLKA
ncbi:MAG: sulfotransferase family protein [Bacteroidota bacterium]